MKFTLTAKARANVTAKGRPSGTPTTITVIALIKYDNIYLTYLFDHVFFLIPNSSITKRKIKIIKVNAALVKPT